MSEDSGARVLAGRYRLITPLGQRMTRGWDLHLRQVVAVRMFPPPDGTDQVVERASVLADLAHPGLVRVLDAGNDNGEPFLVCEFVVGTALSARLAEGPLEPDAVGVLGVGLARALAYAHSHGVLHRDVEPGNILVGPAGEPYLTHLGIAETPTPSYMAPEQVRRNEPSAAADVYALGLVLLEALTGRKEYRGDDIATMRARLTHPPAITPDLPFAAALEAMTRSDPAKRPDAATCVDLLRGSSEKSRVQTRTVLLAAVAAATVATGLTLAFSSPQPQQRVVPRGVGAYEENPPAQTVPVQVPTGAPGQVDQPKDTPGQIPAHQYPVQQQPVAYRRASVLPDPPVPPVPPGPPAPPSADRPEPGPPTAPPSRTAKSRHIPPGQAGKAVRDHETIEDEED